MKGKLKVFALLLAATMSVGMFTGCKGNSTGSGSDSGDGKGEVVKLTWYHWGNQPNQPDAVIKALNEKSAKDIGVEL